jgi:beta-N-acetylhexosaminidase
MNARRRAEMRAYSKRHYGYASARLHPKVIVEHIAVAGSVRTVFNTFAPDVPDPELNELPNACSHYVVGKTGRIVELVSPRWRCRHTVGLNNVAIGIEHVGFTDGDVLHNRRSVKASLRLTAYLRCRFHIAVENVIGHSESLSSPYHRERVKRLRTQTHADWSHRSMRVYRRRLARIPCETAG